MEINSPAIYAASIARRLGLGSRTTLPAVVHQIVATESRQSVRCRRRARRAQHLTVDAPADASVEESQPNVDGSGSLPGLLDQRNGSRSTACGGLALHIQISLRHPFTMFTGSFVTSWILGSNTRNNLVYDFHLARGSRTLIPRSAPPIDARSVETC
jgi:hypothetical protein